MALSGSLVLPTRPILVLSEGGATSMIVALHRSGILDRGVQQLMNREFGGERT